jgi:type II secretory pathway predicted ATPase ExeA/pSer/pThr/pTyr-binding forkhead associated (FHA) protein
MYSELFKLNEPPFRLTPDPEFLFASKQHARAKAYMESTIWLADGFVVITGEIGAGKTTLIESFLSDLPEDVVLAHVSQTQLSPIEFLQAVLVEFGFREFHDRKVELLATLKDFMIEQYSQGKTLLLIVDEAQNLSHKVLEEIRLLSGIESQKEKPLRIILAGQPELSDKLDSLRLEQLRQRVRLRFHLTTLTKRETGQYIQHRLDIAGANGRRIFDKDSIDLIFRYAGGVPRLTNVLCDTAMLCGFSEGKDTIDVGLINEAINELQWVEYDQRFENRGKFSASHAAPRPAERKLRLVDSQGPGISGLLRPNLRPQPDIRSETMADEPAESAQPAAEHSGEEHSRIIGPLAPARFDVLFKNQHITEFDLPMGRAVVGRTGDNDLQIRSRFVSRHHIQINTDNEKTTVEDLNSTNGMLIEGKRVQYRVMEDGDVIQLGEHKLVYRNLRAEDDVEHTSPHEEAGVSEHDDTYTPGDNKELDSVQLDDNADDTGADEPSDTDEGAVAAEADHASQSPDTDSEATEDAGNSGNPDDDDLIEIAEYDGAQTRVFE